MALLEKNVTEIISSLFEGLSPSSKMELIDSLSKSLKEDLESRKLDFFESYGSFDSSKSAEEILYDIKASRRFVHKDINL